MFVRNVPLFVGVVREDDTKLPGGSWFQTKKFKVPIFKEVTVAVTNETIFIKKGKKLSRAEVEELLRGYILKPSPHPSLHPAERKLIELITPTFLDGLWIRVSGELCAEQLEGDDVIEDEEKAMELIGDMDMPIIGLAPWLFLINATVIELEIKPSPYYPGC